MWTKAVRDTETRQITAGKDHSKNNRNLRNEMLVTHPKVAGDHISTIQKNWRNERYADIMKTTRQATCYTRGRTMERSQQNHIKVKHSSQKLQKTKQSRL